MNPKPIKTLTQEKNTQEWNEFQKWIKEKRRKNKKDSCTPFRSLTVAFHRAWEIS